MHAKPWQVLGYALVGCVFVLTCATFLDYGLTWDEERQATNGVSVLKWYVSLFRDDTALRTTESDLYLYGGFFDSLASGLAYLAWKLFNGGFYETRHLITALVGLAAIVGAYKLGSLLSGPAGGFFSALFLVLTPVFYGHLFNNPKDIPFATCFVFSLYYLLLSYDTLPRAPKKLLVKLGIAIGLTLGIRIGGILLFGYLLFLWTGWLMAQYGLTAHRPHPSLWIPLRQISCSLGLTLILAWAVMLVWWPWAQISPLLHPLKALQETARFRWSEKVFFNGCFMPAAELPWIYLPTWFGISLPEFYGLALLMGGVLTCKFIINFQRTRAHVEWLIKISLLVVVVCSPVLIAIIIHATVYDGMRHFLFLVPILAVLAGISLAGLLRSHVSLLVKGSAGVLIGLSAGMTGVDMVQLHPYQSVYFNRTIAGGLAAGASRFETDYWGNSYKEGVEWVIQHYDPPVQGPIRVANCAERFQTSYFLEQTEHLRHRFVTVRPAEHPHLLLATTRWECHKQIRGTLLHVVERQGTPLLYVIEVSARDGLNLAKPEISAK
jgi:Dolichyl-phosphate-mannose-protein mannosyltransferase